MPVILLHSLWAFAAVCVCVWVCEFVYIEPLFLAPGPPALAHAFRFGPWAVCLSYIRPQYIDPVNEMKLRSCVLPPLYVCVRARPISLWDN